MGGKKIYKYILPISDDVSLVIQEGAECLTVQVQYGQPCLWAIVQPDKPFVEKRFCIRGTGHSLKGNEGKYLGHNPTRHEALLSFAV